MKLGEKLQRLRKDSGLSQEQLAAQLTVSRQAVSKWELDETMPDTENVVQLSRLFGVSCDYLLREEVDERGEALPTAPGETHLDEPGWERNAFVLSLCTCAIGLLVALGGWLQRQTTLLLIIGLIVELSGVALFELAVPRMGERRKTARLTFYMAANWLLIPIPMLLFCWWGLPYFIRRPYPTIVLLVCLLFCWLLLSGAATAVLAVLRRRLTAKK